MGEPIGSCRFPMAQAMPHIHNLVSNFLTAPDDRKMSPWVRKAHRLQLSAYLILRNLSHCDCINAELEAQILFGGAPTNETFWPADFRILVDGTLRPRTLPQDLIRLTTGKALRVENHRKCWFEGQGQASFVDRLSLFLF